MSTTTDRRTFVAASALLGLAPLAPAAGAARRPVRVDPADDDDAAAWAAFPRQRVELVRDVVGASHAKLDVVREMVTAHPSLAKAAWDWGFGDWESALGAASHTGQREIALLLIEHGARPDIFTFAMLGNLDAVKAIVAANPGVQRIPGPHSIPLLRHAKAGGEAAAEVAAYLESLGDAGIEPASQPLTSEQRAAYMGTYRIEDAGAGGLTVEIGEMREWLAFTREGQSPRRLVNLGEHRFLPVGAPEVRLVFEMEGAKAAAMTIVDHEPVVRGVRV